METTKSIADGLSEILSAHEHWQRPNRYRDWECACGKFFGLKKNLDHHIADLQVAYLREHFAFTPLIERGDNGWSIDPDDDDFRVTRVHLVDQHTGGGLTGCRIAWGQFYLNLSPVHAEATAAALLSALRNTARLEPR